MRLIDADVLLSLISEVQKDYPLTDRSEKAKVMRNVLFDMNEVIKDLPTIPQWIPVSERLPKSGVQVICCNGDGRVFTSCRTGLSFIDGNRYPIFGQHYGVIAWMPLPKPFKRGEEE